MGQKISEQMQSKPNVEEQDEKLHNGKKYSLERTEARHIHQHDESSSSISAHESP